MTEIDWDNLPASTAQTVSVSVQGFTNQQAGERLGRTVGECVMTLGSFMDLSTLDGVTVAVDYDAALAGIDQGMAGLRPLSRTDTEEMQGVAKTCQVSRDGEVKSHLVFNAAMLVPLIAEEQTSAEDRQTAIGIIAHECGHVQVNAQLEKQIPHARLGARIEDFERAVLFQIAEICWDEYAVCRLSAPFAPRQNQQHAETVAAVLPGARARAKEGIKAYRLHGDLHRLLGEAGSELCQPLKAASYLLGGLDAEDRGWAEFAEARAAIDEAGYGALVDALHEGCRHLWDSQSEWTPDRDVLAPLIAVARDAFASGGIYFRRESDGRCRVNVPLSVDTLPG